MFGDGETLGTYIMTDLSREETCTKKEVSGTKYMFKEMEIIDMLKAYVDVTYTQHYGQGKHQTLETVDDTDGLAFCKVSIQKYLNRYGKKDGFNRKDLLKIAHYSILAIYFHDEIRNNN